MGSTVGTVTSLQVCKIWGLIPSRGNISFFLLINIQTSSEAQPAYYSMDRGSVLFCWGYGSLGVKLATHIYLMSRFRMSAAIILLPLYAFMTYMDNFISTNLLNFTCKDMGKFPMKTKLYSLFHYAQSSHKYCSIILVLTNQPHKHPIPTS